MDVLCGLSNVALSNKAFTPGGAVEIAHILGKEETSKKN